MGIREAFGRLSVNQKIGLLLAAMLVIAGLNVAVVFHYQSQVQQDSNAVDVAGQQRMLTQRMTRFANSVATGNEQAQEPLRAAMEKYQANLDALKTGGTVGGTQVPAAPASAQEQLRAEEEGWQSFKANVQTVLSAEPGTDGFSSALSELQSNSDSLLTTSDDLVTALSAASSQQITFMQQLLLALFAVDVAVFLVGLFVGRRYIGTPLKKLDEVAADIADGNLEADVEGTHAHFRTGDDEIAGLAATVETLRENVRERIEAAETAKEKAETARADAHEAKEEAEQLNEHLHEKATAFSTTMTTAAEGDFTQRMDATSDTEAMTDIAEAFNAMMDELEETFARIRSFADEVATSSEEVTAGAEESQKASQQVSESIQEIAAEADLQSENHQEIASEMQSLSGTVEEVASSANEIAKTSEQSVELGHEGQDAAADAMDELISIEEKSETTVDEINALATEIEEIGEIVELITDIAEQTNMLALNASIEAARAGEAGEGFAVVADEIKQLAGEVGEATDDVESLITDIQSSTSTAVTDIQEMGDRVSAGKTTIENALTSLDEVASNVEDTNRSIQEISDATDDQASSTEEVASMIDEVAEAAKEVSDESETVSAAAEEQTSSLTQVAHSTETLSDRADDLQTLLAQFTISERERANRTGTATGTSQVASADGGDRSGTTE
jgi:methyl-accepting chemotaxis protein